MADQDLGTTIKFTVDATGVEAGTTRVKRSLKDVGKTASEVGKQTGDAIGGGGDDAAKKVEAATRRIKNEFKRLQVDAESMGKTLSEKLVIKADAYGIPRAAIEEQLTSLKAFEAAQRATNPAMIQFQKLADQSGQSVAGLNAALRQVPAQFTDIVTSLQGGQKPLTVLLQQGGQLKDAFGGIVPAARALGGYVASLINPFSLAAAAVATLGASYYYGSKELDAYNKALILTGNAVGLTSGQLSDMASAMAAVGGTQSKAAEALVEFVNAGAAGAGNLEKFAASAVAFEKATGTAVSETAKQFAELGKAPLEASIKLNESTGFLTMSLYEQVKALEEQGKKTEAAKVVQQAYADTLNQNTAQITANLGTIEKSWNAITSATKGAWDWMMNVGRATGPQQQLAKLASEIASKEAIINAPYALDREKNEARRDLQPMRDKYDELSKTNALAAIRASERAIDAKQRDAQIAFDKEHEKYMTNAIKLERELAKAKELYLSAPQDGERGEKNRKAYEDMVAKLKDQYKEKAPTKAKAEKVEGFGKELSATKEWLATQERMLKDSYSTQQKDLEDSFKSQEITAAQYYARQLASDAESLQQREQIRAEAQARFDAEMSKRVAITQARPESKAKSTALNDLRTEAENFTSAQEAARQKDINSMAKHSNAIAREIDKESQKVTGSVDAYIADMQRKAEADAKLLAAREAMAGQAPEIIAGMEAELKVRADAAKLLDQTAQAYADASKEARKFEETLADNYGDGIVATKEELALLETLQSAAVQARKKLLELGGAVDTTALDASITATAASIKKQTDEVAKEIQKTLVDGIMSAGKDGGAGLRKALEDVLVTKPFRIVVEAMLQPVSNAIAQGVMGQSLGAGEAGAGGISSALNAASLAVSSFGSTLIGTAANVATGGATLAQTWAAGSAMMNTAGGTMAGIAMKIGAAAPYLAAAVVAAKGVEALTTINVSDAGKFLYGYNTADGFKSGGRQDYMQEGGFRGSNKNSSWFDPAPEVTKYMAAVSDAITTSIKDTAKAIGLNTDAIAGYNKQIEVSIGGLDGPQTKSAIDKAFVGMADDMVQSLFGGMLLPLSKSGETASQTMTRLVSDLQAVNGVLADLNKPLMDMSLSGADATEALLKSVGGMDKFKQLATALTTVNDGLEKLGLPLLDISVAGAQAAAGLLTATENALKAKEAADKLQSETDSFSMALLTANGQSTTGVLKTIADRTMAAVKASMPTIGDWASLSKITPEQYAGYSEADRTKLNAAVAAHNTLRSAMDDSSKAAESAAKSAKDAADTAAKAYSDALQSVQDDTQSILTQTADIGKTEFQKQIAQIQRDGAKKQAELDKLSTASDKAAKEYADLTKAATDSSKAVTTLADVFDDASAGAKALGGTASKMIADIAAALAKAGVKTPAENQAQALAMTVVRASTGGAIAGAGTGTSDSIPAMLSDGEYVIKASSAAKLGTRFLDAINAGGMPATVFRADGGSVGFDPNSKKSIIDTWVGALNWSAETMLSSALTLQNVAEDNNITVSQLKEFGYSLDNFSSDTKALIQASIAPKTWDWANGAASVSGGQPYTPTSSAGATSVTGGASAVTENTVAKLTGAYTTQLADLSKLYGSTDTFATAVTKLKDGTTTASGDTGVGKYAGDVSATGIKDYIQGLLTAANGPKNTDGTFTTAAMNAVDVLDAMGTSIATVTKTLEERQTWQDKLDVLTGKTTEQALSRQKELAGTTDTATLKIIEQVHAQDDLAKATAALKTYTDAYASLNVELVSAMGDKSQAYAVQKAIDLADVYREQTPATAALISKQYDLNAARKEEIELLNSAKTRLENYTNAGASKGVELLRLQGDTAGADKAQEAIDLADVIKSTADAIALLATEGLTPLDKAAIQATIQTNDLTIAQYARNKALDQEIETLRRYKAMSDTATSALDNTANSVTNSRIGLLNAQGNTAGAAALQRELDITPYTKAIKDAQTELEKATTATEKSTLADVVAKNTQAIANYDLSKSLDKEAESARAAQEAANALAQAYKGLQDQILQANIELMKASGNAQGAEEAAMALALRDHAGDEYYASLYRELLTIQKLTEARQQLNTLEDSALQKQIALMRAKGDGIFANAVERSAALKTLTAPAASAKAELDRSNMNFGQFISSKGLSTNLYDLLISQGADPKSLTDQSVMAGAYYNPAKDPTTLAALSSNASGHDTNLDAISSTGVLPGALVKLFAEYRGAVRTTEQKSTLQGVVDTASGIAAAYDLNKSLESELKILELQDEAYKNSLDAQKAVIDAQKAYADVLKSTINTMQDFLKTLDGAASPLQNLSSARVNFRAVADKAATGDTSAYKDLTPAAKTFLDLSKSYSKSIQDYRRDEAQVRATLNAVIRVNQNELDKIPKEIASAADPTKDAWLKLQEATKKEAETSFMLTALSVDKAESTKRLQPAEETLAKRYIEAVVQLEEVKRTPLLDAFKDAVKNKVADAALPDYSATFALGDIWGTKIAGVLPQRPMTNAELEALISGKFPGLKPSDFHVPLTPSQLAELLKGKFPTLTAANLVGVPADMVDLVNKKLQGILPTDFAGSKFNAKEMMQTAIDQMVAALRPAASPAAVAQVQASQIAVSGYTPGTLNTAVNNVLGAGYTDKHSIGTVGGLIDAAKVAGITGFTAADPASQIASAGFTAGSLNTAVNAVLGAGYTDKANIGTIAGLVEAAKRAKIPGFAVGTNYVPQDMIAQIHEGEAIIPAPFNPAKYGRDSGNTALVEKIQELTAKVEVLTQKLEAGQNAIAANTGKMARTMTKFDIDGLPAERT